MKFAVRSMFLSFLVLFPASIFLFPHWERLNEYVSPSIYRPAHFLTWVVFVGVLYFVLTPPSKWRWPKPGLERHYIVMSLATFGLLWIAETVFGFQARHFVALVIYGVPIVITALLHYGREQNH